MRTLLLTLLLAIAPVARGVTLDLHPGDSLSEALTSLHKSAKSITDPAIVTLHGGTYYLDKPLLLTPEDSNITFTAVPDERVTLSGASPVHLIWSPYPGNKGILQAPLPDSFDLSAGVDQLFINGDPQILARYPNFDPTIPIFNGHSGDALSPERVKTWSDPAGGFIHAMHKSLWGSLEFQITGKDAAGNLQYTGGYQTNRPAPMHKDFRYVENIFEELDAPHEFFLDTKKRILYYIPPKDLDLAHATIELVRLQNLIEIRGTHDQPVTHVSFQNITFTQTRRTFMQTKEPLLRTDWAIFRGGAVLVTGSEDCTFDHCNFLNVGGNALFFNDYNRRANIQFCHIKQAGASGISFVGSPKAVRDPLFVYAAPPVEHPDLTPGPLTDDYPKDCFVSNCLIHETGRVEKQSAGVEIDISSRIHVAHCSIYDVPRAGINIGDGCFGGHIIEFCDVFDTVLETGDHGSFNSWGRDRFWSRDRKVINQRVAANPTLPLLDVIEPNTLRNSRWRCDHGWDIDLDDGSSNYQIYNNLLLSGGLKFREGYDRVGKNNVLINCTFYAHVWLNHSNDIFTQNIVMRPYHPVGMPSSGDDWGGKVDNNFFTSQAALTASQKFGVDIHSLAGDPRFLNPKIGDFRIADNSPANKTGFQNFAMDNFGVTDVELRKLARSPIIPAITLDEGIAVAADTPTSWLGAQIKSIATDGEVSAAGLSEKAGVLLLDVPRESPAAKAGFEKLDVILAAEGRPIRTVADLLSSNARSLRVMRNQSEIKVDLP